MQISAAGGVEVEFLSDPVDRFPLRDLAAAQPLVAYETYKSMECEPAESSIGDVETLRSTVIAMRLPCLQQHLSILRAKTPLKPQAGGRECESEVHLASATHALTG